MKYQIVLSPNFLPVLYTQNLSAVDTFVHSMKKTSHLIAAVFIATSLTHSAAAADSTARAKPNILFILTDDQGYGDWSTNGHPLLKTPHVDKLAAESVRLENFYVSPSCSPTRAVLMTGMHEFREWGDAHTVTPRAALEGRHHAPRASLHGGIPQRHRREMASGQ